ncbi:MAG: hypothetical protein ABIQ95_15260 [Bdellovibrionia bacterium]
MKSKFTKYLAIGFLMYSFPTFALDQITRPYQSVRSFGMGGTRITTGLYDDNFFGNPARVMANPTSKFTFLDITPIDINTRAINLIGPITAAGSDALTTIANAAGSNLHERFQFVLPGYYLAATGDRKFALAFGLLTSFQMDVALRQSYRLNLGAVMDVGPAITAGYKFGVDDAISVGLTTHLSYRVTTDPNYNLTDYISGSAPSIANLAGDGSMIDFDLGATYRVGQLSTFDIVVAGAIQNILGGTYSNLSIKPLKFASGPINQPRSYGLGVTASRPSWGSFANTTFAIEASDVLNNRDGSFFRLIHLGAETSWGVLTARLGINQGYLTAGLGLDLRFFTLNLATYGEELGLNAGVFEDRRYAGNIGFHF